MRKFQVILLMGALLFLPSLSKAAHIVGGELSYECLGSNNYRITLKLYRDCFSGGAEFDNPAYLFIYDSDGVWVNTITMNFPGSTLISPDLDDPCLVDPPMLCVQEAVYTETVNLPPISGGYDVVYQRCCRNNTIVNLISPDETGSTYLTHIPGPEFPCNSGPVFNNFPPILICRNQPLAFDHSATDIDGDSLVYQLCTPFQGASPACPAPQAGATVPPGCPTNPGPPPYDPVFFLPPFNSSDPIDADPNLAINPVTGLLTGTPAALGQYVVGICVEEYRDGVLIGTHRRDFQFNLANCDPLILARILHPADDSDQIINCEDYTVEFPNFSVGASSYLWDFGVPGTDTDISSDPFPVFTYPDTGTYTVTLIADPGAFCSDTARVNIIIYPLMVPDFSFVTSCGNDPTPFTDLTTNTYGFLDSWYWNFGGGNFSDEQNPEFEFGSGGNFQVGLITTTNLGCVDTIIKTIDVLDIPEVNIDAINPCLNETALFSDISTISSGTIVGSEWQIGSTTLSGSPVEYTFTNTGTYAIILTSTSSDGCINSDTIEINILPPVDAIAGPDTTICEDESVQLFAEGGFYYSWEPAFNLSEPNIADPIASPVIPTNYTVTVSDDCTSDIAEVFVDVLPAPIINAGPDTTIFRGDEVALFSTGGVSYSWSPPDDLSNPLSSNPIATPFAPIWYYVTVTAANGCSRIDSVLIIVNPRCEKISFPNAFTPNGDGQNDKFRALSFGDDIFVEMMVYNRWGEMVFRSRDPLSGWDGTYKGKQQEMGTYIYYVLSLCEGELTSSSGNITLLR